jgi:hypothetical protein
MRKIVFIFALMLAAAGFAAEPFTWKAATVNGQLVVTVDVAKGYYLTLSSVLTAVMPTEHCSEESHSLLWEILIHTV